MIKDSDEWRPGSFTKNFSWGPQNTGLRQLYDSIRIGFDNEVCDVEREIFRERVKKTGRPDYIPINFFLFNKISDGKSLLLADELVFQAINFKHSTRFDKLALHAFNLSLAGRWKGAHDYQRRPSEWARHYIIDRVAGQLNWNTSEITADDIQRFVSSDRRYTGQDSRKLATNLNYLYRVGHLNEFSSAGVEPWWVDAIFLTLDRVIEDRKAESKSVVENKYGEYLALSGFQTLTGKRSIAKDLATSHLIRLYTVSGGQLRFSDESVRLLTQVHLPELQWYVANDQTPIGAVHPTNARIIKAIPRACAMLAKYVGFETLELEDLEDLEDFDISDFIKRHTKKALDELRDKKITPTMSAEDLLKLTRDR